MRFAPTEEQQDFAATLDDLLTDSDTPGVVRAWGAGDTRPGLALWAALAELGLMGLCVPEEHGGLGTGPVEMVIAFEQLGRHLVPGPLVESIVATPVLLEQGIGEVDLSALAEGTTIVTLAAPPHTPFALDADVAGHCLLLDGSSLRQARVAGEPHQSMDAARRLFPVDPGTELAELAPDQAQRALDAAALACSAQLLGMGEHLLDEAVAYTSTRKQFGKVVGQYQALKHAMADVRVALDFARPLLHGAALSVAEQQPAAGRDVSAAKVAVTDAAYFAARTSLQMHGAIGYTQEHNLGLWVLKVRALRGAWGSPEWHRSRVLAAITGGQS